MKNIIDAVKYGIETLKISPEDMFALIESSKDYTGEDYPRWLANEIIKLAEADDVGFSQLLVKRFSIISTIMEGLDATIRQDWLDMFKKQIGEGAVVSVNFSEIGEVSESISWYEGADTLAETPFADSLKELGINFSENFSIVAKLESNACSKSSDLAYLSKNWNIPCKTEGALLLYRMCNFIEASDMVGSNFSFAFLANVNFLTSSDNKEVLAHFLKYYSYTGFTIKAVDLMSESYAKGEYVFCVCKPREGSVQDGFVLPRCSEKEGKFTVSKKKYRFSRSETSMLDYLKEFIKEDSVYGWLQIPVNSYDCIVSLEQEEGCVNIPITKNNLEDIIVYYALVHSLGAGGMGTDLKCVMSGSADYMNLLYNCVPLFLFNTNSKFKSSDGIENPFDINSPLVKKLLDKGEVYFSYESKELLEICKGFLAFIGEEVKGMSFEEVRKEANHAELNSSYMSALVNIKDYIRSTYRKVE